MIGVTRDQAPSTSSARVNSDASPSRASRIKVSYASGESTVNAEPGGDVRLGFRLRVDLRLLPVALDGLAGHPARAVLAADDVCPDLVRGQLADRPDHLDLLVAQGVGVERRRRLHGDEAHQLQQVVLEEVAARARLLVERAPVLDPDRLGDRDLDVVDVAAV